MQTMPSLHGSHSASLHAHSTGSTARPAMTCGCQALTIDLFLRFLRLLFHRSDLRALGCCLLPLGLQLLVLCAHVLPHLLLLCYDDRRALLQHRQAVCAAEGIACLFHCTNEALDGLFLLLDV